MILWLRVMCSEASMSVASKVPDCVQNCSSTNCPELANSGNPQQSRLILLSVIALMFAIFLYKKYNRKLYLIGGILISVLFTSLLFVRPDQHKKTSDTCVINVSQSTIISQDTSLSDEFIAPGDEFVPAQEKDSFQKASPEITVQSISSGKSGTLPDEFAPPSTEFSSADSSFVKEDLTSLNEDPKSDVKPDYGLLYQLAVLFVLLIFISYFIKYEWFRKTRGLFLLASVAYLGFFKGACPCMILSFQNSLLALMGASVEWISLVWFLGLLPLTYFFGKVWCGWLCHLGGFQDFLFQSPKLDLLKSRKTQTVLRYIRLVMLIVLIIQLLVTRTNIYIHYDPFKVAFNLFSANTTGYVLLVLLLILSVLIYRPFCRAFCPVGLILGWVSLIPGARQLAKKETCIDCPGCSNSCRSEAMIFEEKKSTLNVEDCIMCGECMGSCKRKSLYILNRRE